MMYEFKKAEIATAKNVFIDHDVVSVRGTILVYDSVESLYDSDKLLVSSNFSKVLFYFCW